MTYQWRSPTAHSSKDDHFVLAQLSPKTVGTEARNAIPTGTVAERLGFLRDLTSTPQSSATSSVLKLPDPRPLFSPGISTRYRKPQELGDAKDVERNEHDQDLDMVVERSASDLVRSPDDSDLPWEQGNERRKYTIRTSNHLDPTIDLAKSAKSSTHQWGEGQANKTDSNSSIVTSSTHRRHSVRQLFEEYGISGPSELSYPETTLSSKPTTMPQTAIRYKYCHNCTWLNSWDDDNCSRCKHRLCVECDVFSMLPLSRKASWEYDEDVAPGMTNRLAMGPLAPKPTSTQQDSNEVGGESETSVMQSTETRSFSMASEKSPSQQSGRNSLGKGEQTQSQRMASKQLDSTVQAGPLSQLGMPTKGSSPTQVEQQSSQPSAQAKADPQHPPARWDIKAESIKNNPFLVTDRSRSNTQASQPRSMRSRDSLASIKEIALDPFLSAVQRQSKTMSGGIKVAKPIQTQYNIPRTSSPTPRRPLSRHSLAMPPAQNSFSFKARDISQEQLIPSTMSTTRPRLGRSASQPPKNLLYDRSRLKPLDTPRKDKEQRYSLKHASTFTGTSLSSAALKKHIAFTEPELRNPISSIAVGSLSYEPDSSYTPPSTYRESGPDYFGLRRTSSIANRSIAPRVRAMAGSRGKNAIPSVRQEMQASGKEVDQSATESARRRALAQLQGKGAGQVLPDNVAEPKKISRLSLDRMAFLSKGQKTDFTPSTSEPSTSKEVMVKKMDTQIISTAEDDELANSPKSNRHHQSIPMEVVAPNLNDTRQNSGQGQPTAAHAKATTLNEDHLSSSNALQSESMESEIVEEEVESRQSPSSIDVHEQAASETNTGNQSEIIERSKQHMALPETKDLGGSDHPETQQKLRARARTTSLITTINNLPHKRQSRTRQTKHKSYSPQGSSLTYLEAPASNINMAPLTMTSRATSKVISKNGSNPEITPSSQESIWNTSFIYTDIRNATKSFPPTQRSNTATPQQSLTTNSPSQYHQQDKVRSTTNAQANKPRKKRPSQRTEVHSSEYGDLAGVEDGVIEAITVTVHFQRREDLVLKIDLKGERSGVGISGKGIVVIE